ncbi:hypothetical protein ACFLYG_02165 [Chloroflexota bacterium]
MKLVAKVIPILVAIAVAVTMTLAGATPAIAGSVPILFPGLCHATGYQPRSVVAADLDGEPSLSLGAPHLAYT